MNKLIMFVVVGLLVVGCVCIVSYNNLEKDNRNIEEEKDIVINPITGEKWDSVEEYRFRNTNSSEALE